MIFECLANKEPVELFSFTSGVGVSFEPFQESLAFSISELNTTILKLLPMCYVMNERTNFAF